MLALTKNTSASLEPGCDVDVEIVHAVKIAAPAGRNRHIEDDDVDVLQWRVLQSGCGKAGRTRSPGVAQQRRELRERAVAAAEGVDECR